MINLFKHLVRVAIGSLLVAVALNWYGRYQDTLARFVRRLQMFTALVQEAPSVNCKTCGKAAIVQQTQEGGELGWTRSSSHCTHCGHSDSDLSIASAVQGLSWGTQPPWK